MKRYIRFEKLCHINYPFSVEVTIKMHRKVTKTGTALKEQVSNISFPHIWTPANNQLGMELFPNVLLQRHKSVNHILSHTINIG